MVETQGADRLLETRAVLITLHPLGYRDLADNVADVRDPHVALR